MEKEVSGCSMTSSQIIIVTWVIAEKEVNKFFYFGCWVILMKSICIDPLPGAIAHYSGNVPLSQSE